MHAKKRMAVIVLAVLWTIAGYLCGLIGRAGNRQYAQDSGQHRSARESVGFKVPGRIVELPVQEGQYVDKGDLLARLDDDDYRQQ